MAFSKEIEQFEFEFDQEWADMTKDDEGNSIEIEWFDLTVRSPYAGQVVLSLSIEQAREIRDIIDAEIQKYEAWKESANGEA